MEKTKRHEDYFLQMHNYNSLIQLHACSEFNIYCLFMSEKQAEAERHVLKEQSSRQRSWRDQVSFSVSDL